MMAGFGVQGGVRFDENMKRGAGMRNNQQVSQRAYPIPVLVAPMLTTDTQSHITYASEVVVQVSGCCHDEVLGLIQVAEGIEITDQLAILAGTGREFCQDWLIAKAIGGIATTEVLNTNSHGQLCETQA